MFISFIYSVSSLKTFEIEETEKLSLGIETEDPDADQLIYTFTEPLDQQGEWQTAYGDAGEYASKITVSDGEKKVSEEILIIVNRKEEEPVISKFVPEEEFLTINEGKSIKFRVDASDLNKDQLTYSWMLNGEAVPNNENKNQGNNEIIFNTGYDDSGEYIITLIVSDGIFNASKEWNIIVNDVGINSLLDQIKDIKILETETARLELPDFKQYGLNYEISGPLGNNNEWKTNYDDAGEYTVIVNVEGKGFEGQKEVKITVKNKDRSPKFVGLDNANVKENEQLEVELKAIDDDEDKITFSAKGLPETAELNDNIFTFNPDYDFVQKNNALDYVLDKFRILGRSANIVFVAQSNELTDKKAMKVRVKDVNRPFILESVANIEANEGEEIMIEPKYSDPDKDRVSFSYSGFMNSNKKKLGFDDAGEYTVKVTATDDYFTETKLINIKVNDVNRKPLFDKMKNVEVAEGSELKIELSASDPDNDAVSFSAEKLPEGAKLKDNLFVWKPGFDVVNGTEKEFSVNFIVSDGIDEESQKAKITVLNVNQAPKIVSYSDNLIVLKDKPTLFELNAVDEDGNDLTYSWNFGFFSKFEGENQHQRIFTTKGSKEVEVTVSDGLESVSKVWNVEVI